MYLVDTSVWVELLKESEDWEKALSKLIPRAIFVSPLIITEISKWCCLNSANPHELIHRIENVCHGVLYTTTESEIRSAQMWIAVNQSNASKGRQVGIIDCIIAATAEENGLTVLTKDRHFLLFEGIEKEIV